MNVISKEGILAGGMDVLPIFPSKPGSPRLLPNKCILMASNREENVEIEVL